MKVLTLAAAFGCVFLSGCGIYFHSDGYQKLTDSAADAVEASAFKEKVAKIGTAAVSAQGAYEASIVQSELAQRDYFVAAAVRRPILFNITEIQPVTGPDGSVAKRYGLSLMEAVANDRLSFLVSNDLAAKYARSTVGVIAEFKSARRDLFDYTLQYANSVKAFKAAYPKDKETDLACPVVIAEADQISVANLPLFQVLTECQHIAEQQARINSALFDKAAGPNCKNPANRIESTACAIADTNLRKTAAEKKGAEISAEIRKIQEELKAKEDQTAGPAQIEAILKSVDDIKEDLSKAPALAKAAGFEELALMLQEVLVDDLNEALASSKGDVQGAAAPKTDGAARAALVGSVIRAFTTGLTFGQGLDEGPKNDPNVTIIALAELRNHTALAKLEAATESERAELLDRMLQAQVAEASNLAIARALCNQISVKSPDTDLMSLTAADQRVADSAIEAFAASIDSGRAVAAVLESRIQNLQVAELTQRNTITADTIDQVNNAVVEALRQYGKGGVDPALVVATILGAAATAGIWH